MSTLRPDRLSTVTIAGMDAPALAEVRATHNVTVQSFDVAVCELPFGAAPAPDGTDTKTSAIKTAKK
jgi:hypothetical protein